MAQQPVNGATVASDDDSFTSIVALDFSKSGNNSRMKLRHRLATRKHHSIRVARKIRSAIFSHKVIKLESVAIRARVMLTEAGAHVKIAVANERGHDVGCLHRAWKRT